MNEDKIIKKLLDHEERLIRIEEKMVTKRDHEKVVGTLDEILGVVKKTDQELTMMGNRVNRIEGQVKDNTKDIETIKPLVGLA